MTDDLTDLRQALNAIARNARTPETSEISREAALALESFDRIADQTRAYAALHQGLAEPRTTSGVADSFVTFLTYIRQDLALGARPERDRPIYEVLDELYDTAKQLRRAR